MSDKVDDYEFVKHDRLGSDTPILADLIATYADAAIESLKQENERLRELLAENKRLLAELRMVATMAADFATENGAPCPPGDWIVEAKRRLKEGDHE